MCNAGSLEIVPDSSSNSYFKFSHASKSKEFILGRNNSSLSFSITDVLYGKPSFFFLNSTEF